MHIRLAHNAHYHFAETCTLCGERFTPDAVLVLAYSETGTQQGLVCDSCVDAGDAALRERIRHQATRLDKRAHALEQLAEEEITVPSRADWQTLESVPSHDASTGAQLAALWYDSLNEIVLS
jgi:hypothetical protein